MIIGVITVKSLDCSTVCTGLIVHGEKVVRELIEKAITAYFRKCRKNRMLSGNENIRNKMINKAGKKDT